MEIRFKVKEAKTGEALLAHQAFVVFVHSITRQEIIFVATPDHNYNYVFDVVRLDFFLKITVSFLHRALRNINRATLFS